MAPTTSKSSTKRRRPKQQTTIEPWRVDIARLLKKEDTALAILNEMYQKGAFSSFEKEENPFTHTVTYSIDIGYKFPFSVTKSSTSLKHARQATADEMLTQIAAHFRERGIRHKYKAPVTRNDDNLTLFERIQMGMDQSYIDKVREIDDTRQEAGHSTLIMSITVEAWEDDHSQVLEVGIAHVNLSLLSNVSNVETTHIVVEDRMYLTNGKHVSDHRESFNFGQSTTVQAVELRNAIMDHINHICTDYEEVYLINHTTKHVIDWLKELEMELVGVSMIDLGQAYRGFKDLGYYTNVVSMEKMLDELNMEYSYLHNSGNNANYSIRLFDALCKLE